MMRYIRYSEAFLVGLFRSTRIVRSKDCSGLLFLSGATLLKGHAITSQLPVTLQF